MSQSTSRLFFLSSWFCISVVFGNVGKSDVNASVASQVGLVVAWEANIGGAPLARGPRSFVLWPHSTAKTEFITVRLGNRLLHRFYGDEVDQAAVEKSILDGERLEKTPRLGLKGADAQAQKLVAMYKKLGKTLDLEPFSQRLTYIVTLTSNGIIEAMDAESGSIHWKAEAGDSRLEMYGPGVSDDYVVITNGNRLFAFDITTGAQIASRSLPFTPTGTPSVFGTNAMIPSIEGRLVAYNILDYKTPPIVLRSGTENRLGVTLSMDRLFMSWPMSTRLFIAMVDPPKLWTSISMDEQVSNVATPTPSGFIFVGRNGTVVHCSTQRLDSVFWKLRLSVPVSKPPVVNQTTAFIVSDEGLMFGLNLENGSEVWDHSVRNVTDIVAVGKKNIYVTNSSGVLVAIDLSTGQETARTSSLVPVVIPNSINDRLYFISPNGQLSCLREPEATIPTFVTPADNQGKPKDTEAKPKESTESTESQNASESTFGGTSTQESTSVDPFGDPK